MTEADAKNRLQQAGYTNVYTWFDSPDENYGNHTHPNERSFIIIEGSMTIGMDDEVQEYSADDQFTIPAHHEHSSTVGPEGCTYVTGER